MAFAPIAHTITPTAASPNMTPARNITGADLVVVTLMSFAGSPAAPSDGVNTWTPLTAVDDGTSYRLQGFYCLHPTTSATYQVTTTTAVNTMIAVQAWRGAAASAFDRQTGTSGATGTTVQPGAVTPSGPGALLLTAAGYLPGAGSPSLSIDLGFTVDDQVPSSFSAFGLGTGSTVLGAAAAQNPTWTISGASFVVADAVLAVFLPAPLAFSAYKTVTIDHTQCGASGATNWPVCLGVGVGPQAADADLKDVAHGGVVQSVHGYDLRPYADRALTTPLPYELVYYDGVNGRVELWVALPAISPSVDTVFYLAFGEASLTTNGSSASTWGSAYQAVWHGGDSTQTHDSTAHAYDLTYTNVSTTSGTIYGGNQFAGTHPSYAVAAAAPVTTFPVTYECWAKLTSASLANGQGQGLIYQGHASNQDCVYLAYYRVDALGGPMLLVAASDALGAAVTEHQWLLTLDTNWHHLVMTLNYVAPNFTATIAIDGVPHTMTLMALIGTPLTSHPTMDQTVLGEQLYEGTRHTFEFNGTLDEVRIIDGVYPADAALMDYNNQKASSTFLTWGARTPVGPVGVGAIVNRRPSTDPGTVGTRAPDPRTPGL